MKLNLLPATVTRGRASKVAWLMSGIIMIASIVGAVMLITTSRAKLAEAKQREANARPQAQATVDEAAYADTVIAEAAGVIRNTNLATAMIAQNEKYPRLYDSVTRWVPAFYRLTAISAAPGEAPPAGAPPAPAPGTPPGATPPPGGTAIVTMIGVLSSYQQYADLMLALMRVQGATSVSRSGYILIDPIVPNLTPEDQVGRPRPENAAPIPDNPLQRLEYFQSQGSTTGFAGAGNFGTGNDLTRGAMPRDSIVTVTLVVAGHDLRVPDARATLSASGGATPAGGPPTGAAPGGPPAGRPPGPGGGGADGQGAGDEG